MPEFFFGRKGKDTMNSELNRGDSHIKMEKPDEDDFKPITHLQGSAIDEQCLPCSDLGSNSRKIKVEVDYDDNGIKRDFTTQYNVDGVKKECYQDGDSGSLNKATSIMITIPNIAVPAESLNREGQSINGKNTKIDACETIPSALQQGREKPSCKPIRKRKRLCGDTDGKDLKKAQPSDESKVDRRIRRNPARSKRVNYKEADGSHDDDCQYDAVGNRQHCYTKNVKMEHISLIIARCQNCRKTYSVQFISKDNNKSLEYLCDGCSSIKQSNTSKECLSEVTHNTESTILASQLIVATRTQKCNAAKHVNASKELGQLCGRAKSSTIEGMLSDTSSGNTILQKHMNFTDQQPSCQIIKSASIDNHERDNTKQKVYNVKMRKSFFRQLGSLKREIRTHGTKKPHKCELCQYACRKSGNLKTHMRIHSGEKPFKCEICQYACRKSSNLQRHMRTHSGERPYKCEICQYACRESSNLQRHMRTHSGERPYKCVICQYACRESSNLQRHMRTHSGERPYKCEICQYACRESSNLQRHMRTHSGEKPNKCEICQYACRKSSNLQRHMRTHSGERPYKCVICQNACKKSSTLKVHMRTHSGEKPYKCEICQYACGKSSTLKVHMRTHSGEKPYKCEICQYACRKSCNLKTHMRIHSGERPYKCEICQYACRESGNLLKHMRIHSREKP